MLGGPQDLGTPAPCLAPTLCGGSCPPSSSGCSPSSQAEPRINFSLFGPDSADLGGRPQVPQAPEAKTPREPDPGTLRGGTLGPLQGRGGAGLVACVCGGRCLPGFLRGLALLIGQSPTPSLWGSEAPPLSASHGGLDTAHPGACLALPGCTARAGRGGGGGRLLCPRAAFWSHSFPGARPKVLT